MNFSVNSKISRLVLSVHLGSITDEEFDNRKVAPLTDWMQRTASALKIRNKETMLNVENVQYFMIKTFSVMLPSNEMFKIITSVHTQYILR